MRFGPSLWAASPLSELAILLLSLAAAKYFLNHFKRLVSCTAGGLPSLHRQRWVLKATQLGRGAACCPQSAQAGMKAAAKAPARGQRALPRRLLQLETEGRLAAPPFTSVPHSCLARIDDVLDEAGDLKSEPGVTGLVPDHVLVGDWQQPGIRRS